MRFSPLAWRYRLESGFFVAFLHFLLLLLHLGLVALALADAKALFAEPVLASTKTRQAPPPLKQTSSGSEKLLSAAMRIDGT